MRRFFIAWALLACLCVPLMVAYAQETPETDEPAAVDIVIDTETVLHVISPYVYGANHGPWALIPADYVNDIETLGITFIRFPGGNWGDRNRIRSYHMDDVMFWAQRMGAEVSVSVNLRDGTPEDAAALVEYANIENDYNIRYWAIGNEPNLFGDDWDTTRANEKWREIADAMLAVDPDILFIGPDISQYTGNPTSDPRDANGNLWLDAFLEANGDRVDVVSVHRYPFPSFSEPVTSIEALRNSTLEWQQTIPRLRETIRTITGEDKAVAVTEINSHWNNALGGDATPDSHFNAIWWADVLGQLIAHNTDIVAYFSLQSNNSIGGYGLYARFNVRPTYYVYKLYQHFGQEMLAAQSSQAFVNVYAARRDDGRVSIMLINLTDDAQPVTLNVSGQADMMALTLDSVPEAFTTLDLAAADSTMTLPAQSVTLLLLEAD